MENSTPSLRLCVQDTSGCVGVGSSNTLTDSTTNNAETQSRKSLRNGKLTLRFKGRKGKLLTINPCGRQTGRKTLDISLETITKDEIQGNMILKTDFLPVTYTC